MAKGLRYLDDTLVTEMKARHDALNIELSCYDTIDFHLNVYLKKIVIKNLKNQPRDLRQAQERN